MVSLNQDRLESSGLRCIPWARFSWLGFLGLPRLKRYFFFTFYHKKSWKERDQNISLQSFSTVLKPNYCRREPLTSLSVDAFGSKHQRCDDIIVMSEKSQGKNESGTPKKKRQKKKTGFGIIVKGLRGELSLPLPSVFIHRQRSNT